MWANTLQMSWLLGACAAVCVVAVQAFAAEGSGIPEAILRFDLDGTPNGHVLGRPVEAALGHGATYVDSAEGQGVEPAEGFAAEIPAGDALARPRGTLAFRFRLSRTDRFVPKVPYRLLLVDNPALRIEYSTAKMYLSVPAAQELAEPHRIQFTHFKGGRWYHLAVAWDAEAGTMDVYLNGVRQEYPPKRQWRLGEAAGPLRLGGSEGDLRIAVDSVEAFAEALSSQQIAAMLKDRPLPPRDYEGRMEFDGRIDVSGFERECVFETDFDEELDVVHENDLFEGEKRIRLPDGARWVLEGQGRAWTEDGRLHVKHAGPMNDTVLWNTQIFPGDFLLEFGFSPSDPEHGLTIINFCATGREGGGIFDLDQPKRDGQFPKYHSGGIACYHTSYWATAPDGVGYRGTANLRKNPGHRLVAIGTDHIAGTGRGPHTVRLCKIGGTIQLETNGKLAVVWTDDGKTLGPVHGAGCIGLRQMRHTQAGSYTHFKVWRLTPKKTDATTQEPAPPGE